MKGVPPLLVLAVIFAATLGVPLGLYRLFTRGRRRVVAEIREKAAERGWKFNLRRWQGDPTAFRIQGWGNGGNWVLKSGGAGETNRGWSAELSVRFPTLAGEVDVALAPRDSRRHAGVVTAPHLAPHTQARLASLSGRAASAAAFLNDAREASTGLAEFDAAYQLLVLPARATPPPLDAALAQRVLHWSADALAPHSVLAWRDPFGFHVHARLPAPPDWPTVSCLVKLAEDFAVRLSAPVGASAPRGVLDKLVARLLG